MKKANNVLVSYENSFDLEICEPYFEFLGGMDTPTIELLWLLCPPPPPQGWGGGKELNQSQFSDNNGEGEGTNVYDFPIHCHLSFK